MAGTSSTVWKRSGDSGLPCLAPALRGNAFFFSPLNMVFAVGFPYVAFITWGQFPSIPLLCVFIRKGYWILSDAFSASVKMTMLDFSFILLMYTCYFGEEG